MPQNRMHTPLQQPVQVAGRFVVEVPETFSIPTLRDLIVTLEAI